MNIRTLNNTEAKTKEPEIKGKVIRNSSVARQILHVGGKDVWLFDIKPDREDPKNKTVFVFRNDDKFQEVLSSVIKKKEKESSETEEDLLRQIAAMRQQIDELTKKDKESKE